MPAAFALLKKVRAAIRSGYVDWLLESAKQVPRPNLPANASEVRALVQICSFELKKHKNLRASDGARYDASIAPATYSLF